MTPTLGFILPGGMELWIILAIFLLLFGHRIPRMARSMGSGIVEFKKGLKHGSADPSDDKDAVGSGRKEKKKRKDGPDDEDSGGSGGDAVGPGSKDSAGSQTQDSGASNG